MRISDWSSDVCSSDLVVERQDENARIGLAKLRRNRIDRGERVAVAFGIGGPDDIGGAHGRDAPGEAVRIALVEAVQDDERQRAVDMCPSAMVERAAIGAAAVEAYPGLVRRRFRGGMLIGHRARSEEHTSELQSLM